MRRQRIARRGEPLKHLLAAFDNGVALGGSNGVEAEREEQVAARCNQPPLAVALNGAEVAGGFELRARRPAAILIAIGQRGLGLQLGLFLVALASEVGFGLQLSSPLSARELAESVDDLVVSYAGGEPDIIDHEGTRPCGLQQEDADFCDVSQID